MSPIVANTAISDTTTTDFKKLINWIIEPFTSTTKKPPTPDEIFDEFYRSEAFDNLVRETDKKFKAGSLDIVNVFE